MNPEQAKALRAPFPKSAIGKMPKGGVQLDFVGHAATTDRLLAVDPEWSWEPVSYDPRGLPGIDEHGGLWIRLTVAGVTRLGYGDAGGKKGPNAIKEAIGDAIRNAAMRFGVALDLWAKEDIAHTTPYVAPVETITPPALTRPVERLSTTPDDDAWLSAPVASPATTTLAGEVAASPAQAEVVRRSRLNEPDGAPTQAQLKMLGALLRGQSREQALAVVSSIVGREVESRNDLSKAETSLVLDALKAAEAAS